MSNPPPLKEQPNGVFEYARAHNLNVLGQPQAYDSFRLGEHNNVFFFARYGTPSILRVHVDGLDANGRWLHATLSQQTLELNKALRPSDGIFYACVTDPAADLPKLLVRIELVGEDGHKLSWVPRFNEIAGQGNDASRPRLSHTAVFNEIGKRVWDYADEHGMKAWQNPQWITKSEAATVIAPVGGSAMSRINHYVGNGRLATWENESAKLRQGRFLVYRSQVEALTEELLAERAKKQKKTK